MAHLGHDEVVRRLIDAGAPPDHIKNPGWTALIEAVVLGDGGPAHQQVGGDLLAAVADRSIGNKQDATPLDLARARGYSEMIRMLKAD
ncbi:hypothetical protein RXV86_09100 [Alisedimentitalea sp. MJ-SS2]|uniref:hypothetical protein n=1 Tax=Aliisedimentitalea sp. MJ-SS2 TaxID=3049795 RepID=UPI0029066BD3|nr:hypothetical protein [Alisedimentitalea sp. MJ-SS2]MDU8927539.1 hypothetical protein [Alisedimentitalea sp. MJ-SS2]